MVAAERQTRDNCRRCILRHDRASSQRISHDTIVDLRIDRLLYTGRFPCRRLRRSVQFLRSARLRRPSPSPLCLATRPGNRRHAACRCRSIRPTMCLRRPRRSARPPCAAHGQCRRQKLSRKNQQATSAHCHRSGTPRPQVPQSPWNDSRLTLTARSSLHTVLRAPLRQAPVSSTSERIASNPPPRPTTKNGTLMSCQNIPQPPRSNSVPTRFVTADANTYRGILPVGNKRFCLFVPCASRWRLHSSRCAIS